MSIIYYSVAYDVTNGIATANVTSTFGVDYSDPSAPILDNFHLYQNGVEVANMGSPDNDYTIITANGSNTFTINTQQNNFATIGTINGAAIVYSDSDLVGTTGAVLLTSNPAHSNSTDFFSFGMMDPSVDVSGQYSGTGGTINESLAAFCFTPDTLISTPTGSTPVQDLVIGDLILNHLRQSVPVKWIGRQRLHPAFAGDNLPICIRQGALGNDLPLRDLFVSPGHAMYIDDCLLIDAKAMINGTTITQVTRWEGDIEYFHIETQNHEIILAEGTPAETFMDNISRACFNNYSEYQALYPDAPEMIELDIPRISHQRQLPNIIKHKLEAISEVLMEIHGVKERMVG